MDVRIYNDEISKSATLTEKSTEKAYRYEINNKTLWIPKVAVEVQGKNAQGQRMHYLKKWFTLNEWAEDLLN